MEEHTTPPNSIDASAARSAEALRTLRERGDSAIESQRERVDGIQQRMLQQIDAIAEAFATHDSESEAANTAANRLELQRLQEELVESQEAWQRERAELETQIEDREKEVVSRTEELDQRQRDLDIQASQLDEESEQFGSLAIEIEKKAVDIDERTARVEERETALDSQGNGLTNRERETDERTQALDIREAEIVERESKAEEQKSDPEAVNLREQLDELAGQCDKLKANNDRLQTKIQARKSQMKESLAQLEQGFSEKEAAFQEDLAARNTECDKLAKALSASADHLEASGEAARQRDELQQKFDLALSDVQRLREKTSTLEQELASRPEPQQSESADLIHLRAERDALADKVSELESKEPEPDDEQVRQEVADLQRRFELAVEDVRELKTENAELNQKLEQAAANSSDNSGSDDEGAMDWEAQKRRLMAQLEGDDLEGSGGGTPERKKEIASIQDTVRITDQVVAEKDRELEALRLQIEEGLSHAETPAEDPAIAEAIDADEVIQQQRERMAKLEEELQQKLRETELDLSVQRAKIAREQSELAEWRMELESMKGAIDASAPDTQGKSQAKRRWLSKLGLSGDEE